VIRITERRKLLNKNYQNPKVYFIIMLAWKKMIWAIYLRWWYGRSGWGLRSPKMLKL